MALRFWAPGQERHCLRPLPLRAVEMATMLESGTQGPWVRWLRINLAAARWITFGIFIASFTGWQLLSERVPHSPWPRAVGVAASLSLLPNIVEGLITMGSWPPSLETSNSGEEALQLLLFLSWVVLMVLRKHEWTSLALGVITGLYFWMIGRMHQRRYLVAVVGWILAGFAVYLLHWPNEQRLMLSGVAGGLATAVQGAWVMHEILSRSG
jgi:hypothetical protein